jgi:hypothetical protein
MQLPVKTSRCDQTDHAVDLRPNPRRLDRHRRRRPPGGGQGQGVRLPRKVAAPRALPHPKVVLLEQGPGLGAPPRGMGRSLGALHRGVGRSLGAPHRHVEGQGQGPPPVVSPHLKVVLLVVVQGRRLDVVRDHEAPRRVEGRNHEVHYHVEGHGRAVRPLEVPPSPGAPPAARVSQDPPRTPKTHQGPPLTRGAIQGVPPTGK